MLQSPFTTSIKERQHVLEWRLRLGKRNGRPQAKWTDDLRRTAGKSWMRAAEDRAKWRAIGEQSSSGLQWADDDDDDD
jgi:hypothetical protein